MGKKKQIFKIKLALAQSFGGAHRYRLCVHVFIGMSDNMYMSIYVCSVFLKTVHSSASWARFLGRGPVKGRLLHEADNTLGQACSIQVCKDFQAVAARTQPRQIPAHELFGAAWLG
jgi:hypothetical protein